jgi:hypothetical protein
VTFYGRGHPSWCRAYPVGRALLRQIFPPHPGAPLTVIVIRPSALPAGAAVYLNDSSNPYGYIGLGFINPAIYRIARSTSYYKAFHDIIYR